MVDLPPPGGTHERDGLSGADVQSEAVDDLVVLLALGVTGVGVSEVDVVVADGALAHAQRPRVGTVQDLRLLVQHLAEAAEARDSLLEGLGEVQDLRDRRREERDVERVGGEVSRLHLTARYQPAAQDHHHGVQRAHHDGNGGLVAAHGTVHARL